VADRSLLLPGLPTDYYAPDYKVEVEGRELDPEAKGDILEVKVTMDLKNLTGFELTVNNWDDKRLAFKYSDTATFDVGNRIHVQMGYASRLVSMARGLITSLSPRFPESGSPTLGVSGLDSMVKLRDRKPGPDDVKKFVNMADWEIAQVVAGRNGLRSQVTEEGEKHDLVVQKNQDEAKFLAERANRIDFDCYIQVDPDTGEDTLYFVKPTDAREAGKVRVYQFEWGKSLINFTPQLTLSEQVGKVTVRGWDPRTKQPITYTAGPEDLPAGGGGGLNGPRAAEDRLAGKQDQVVDQPVTSAQEARDLAMTLLRERAYGYITGRGQVIGLPDLRPGQNVQILGLGKRFSLLYYVTKVEHTLGSSGYLTQFEVRSDADGGLQ
jgi:phage protein D